MVLHITNNPLFPASIPKKTRVMRFRDRETAVFNTSLAIPPPELSAYCRFLRRTLHDSCVSAVTQHRRMHNSWSNYGTGARLAEQLLEESQYFVLPADKGGGYILCPVQAIMQQQDKILTSNWYIDSTQDIHTAFEQASCEHKTLCAVVNKFNDEYSLANLLHSLDRGVKGFKAQLHHTVKAHKAAGSVSFRAIHAMSLYSFEGLSVWLCDVCRKMLNPAI